MFNKQNSSISEISSYSFFVYLIFILLGVFIDLIGFSQKVFSSNLSLYIGFGLIVVFSILIFWAEHASHHYRKSQDKGLNMDHSHLQKGAFRFTRNPYYVGIGFLFLGLSFVINSLAVLALALLSFFVVNMWFIPKEEEILKKRHGEDFDIYKEKTRRWF